MTNAILISVGFKIAFITIGFVFIA
ncbi:uncharacterized protein METZ01_LOCUS437295, partial [marine metagenome]